MYLSYDDFVNMGGAIDEASFPRLEHRARAMIDRMTFGRVSAESPVRKSVQYACFELIREMSQAETSAGSIEKELAAVSNDGVSISYATAKGAGARYRDIVRNWLGGETTACGIPLLYKGVSVR